MRQKFECHLNLTALEDFKVQVAAAQSSDERPSTFSVRLKGWHDEGILTDLCRAKEEAGKICELPMELCCRTHMPEKPQTLATKVLHEGKHTKSEMVKYFSERLSHWFDGDCSERGQKILQNFCTVKGKMPAHSLTAYLKTVGNSWATTSRHGHAPEDCIFGCKDCKDSLGGHYMTCPALVKSAKVMFPHLWTITSNEHFLGLKCENDRDIFCLIAIIDAAHYSYNTVQHSPFKHVWPRVCEHFKERILTITNRAPKARNIIGNFICKDTVWGNDPTTTTTIPPVPSHPPPP